MNQSQFHVAVLAVAAFFTLFFAVVVIPALVANPDVPGAFAAGFVNPFASGYSTDVLCCWLILALWVVYEARALGVRHGWVCLLLGVVPGVAVGFGLYLVLRHRQLGQVENP